MTYIFQFLTNEDICNIGKADSIRFGMLVLRELRIRTRKAEEKFAIGFENWARANHNNIRRNEENIVNLDLIQWNLANLKISFWNSLWQVTMKLHDAISKEYQNILAQYGGLWWNLWIMQSFSLNQSKMLRIEKNRTDLAHVLFLTRLSLNLPRFFTHLYTSWAGQLGWIVNCWNRTVSWDQVNCVSDRRQNTLNSKRGEPLDLPESSCLFSYNHRSKPEIGNSQVQKLAPPLRTLSQNRAGYQEFTCPNLFCLLSPTWQKRIFPW